jgi:branched-chain amino acid transport system ATP-binding protein
VSLTLHAASAGYGAVRALHGVDFEVREGGEWLALLGPVGAGKTTLLGTLAGILPLTSGDVRLGGTSIAGWTAERRLRSGIALVPEGRRLFAGMSVRENLVVGAHTIGTAAKVAARLQEVLALFPVLEQRYDQIAGTLSGGEQQMCAIARALMADPRILLIDEVSLGLAPQIVDRLFEALSEIVRKGTTLVTVEQNVALALERADRACVLRNGVIVADGAAAEWRGNIAIHQEILGY